MPVRAMRSASRLAVMDARSYHEAVHALRFGRDENGIDQIPMAIIRPSVVSAVSVALHWSSWTALDVCSRLSSAIAPCRDLPARRLRLAFGHVAHAAELENRERDHGPLRLARGRAGVQVARLEGVRADTDVTAIVRSVLFGGGQVRVPVPLVHVDSADVGLDRGSNGAPSIADTFLLRNPSPPPPPNASWPFNGH